MLLTTEHHNSFDSRIRSLLSQARTGDQDAVAALYRLHTARLKSAVNKRLGSKLRDKMESVDLVQSVWKDALGDINEFEYRGPDSFFHWLLTRLNHKIQDKGRYFTTEMRDPGKEERLVRENTESPGITPPPSEDPTPSEVAMAGEDLDRVMALLDRLPEPQRQVLVFRMRDELTFERIGEIINKSADAVRKLFTRGMMRLGDLILEAKLNKIEVD